MLILVPSKAVAGNYLLLPLGSAKKATKVAFPPRDTAELRGANTTTDCRLNRQITKEHTTQRAQKNRGGSRLCAAHFEVNNSDAASEQLPDVSDTRLVARCKNLVRGAVNLPITKLAQTSRGNVGEGAAVS